MFLIHSLYKVTSTEQLGNRLRSFNARPAYNGIIDVFKNVYMEGGIRSLYRGVGMVSLCQALIFKTTLKSCMFMRRFKFL